jgi:hypothetical protein
LGGKLSEENNQHTGADNHDTFLVPVTVEQENEKEKQQQDRICKITCRDDEAEHTGDHPCILFTKKKIENAETVDERIGSGTIESDSLDMITGVDEIFLELPLVTEWIPQSYLQQYG